MNVKGVIYKRARVIFFFALNQHPYSVVILYKYPNTTCMAQVYFTNDISVNFNMT